MFHASLAVQLPATLPGPTTAVKGLLAVLFPVPAADDAKDAELRETLAGHLSVFELLLRSFESAGFDDVVAIVVDGNAVYVDTEERIGDIDEALQGLVKSRALDDGFAVMRTTFRRIQDGLEVLGELRWHVRTKERPDETRVRISARPHGHEPLEAEGAREYAARVRQLVHDATRIESQRVATESICAEVGARIKANIADSSIETSPAAVRLIAPGLRQLGRMRHLRFGTGVRRTVSCALPSYERVGPYDDPLSGHYYSPYSDLFHWIAVGEALAGQLSSQHVDVVSATGRHLFRGSEAIRFDPSDFAVSRDVVRVSPEGRLKLDASVPEVAEIGPA
ncbi:MAG: hypothetical protein KUG77_20855, partial [Nannocystaceae bacterium]|nr:hypothetical protein [Nannocystaceae bacterium]